MLLFEKVLEALPSLAFTHLRFGCGHGQRWDLCGSEVNDSDALPVIPFAFALPGGYFVKRGANSSVVPAGDAPDEPISPRAQHRLFTDLP